jgi:hypothetical protein
MRCVQEILRVKHACGASDRLIARSTGVARSTLGLACPILLPQQHQRDPGPPPLAMDRWPIRRPCVAFRE